MAEPEQDFSTLPQTAGESPRSLRRFRAPLAALFALGAFYAAAHFAPMFVPVAWRLPVVAPTRSFTNLYTQRGNSRGVWYITAWVVHQPQGRYVVTSETLVFGWTDAAPAGPKNFDMTEYPSERQAADVAAARLGAWLQREFPAHAARAVAELGEAQLPPQSPRGGPVRDDFGSVTAGSITNDYPDRRWAEWSLSQRGIVPRGVVLATPLLALWFVLRITDAYVAWKRSRVGLCRACGYHLAGLPPSSRACPECGRSRS